jgi:phosphatidylserine/phosphatidylglycerophosphate/cardiolipin synthase-like enzyme
MPAGVGDTRLFFGPSEFGAPDALLTPIVDTILGAQQHLVVATQQLQHREIVNALAIARRHGVRIRVLLERDYLRESPALDSIWERGGAFEAHREALAALYRAGVDVRVDRRARLMHENFIVADAETASPTMVCSSANFTFQGLHRHFNHLLVIRAKLVAAAFMREFEALWDDRAESPHPAQPARVDSDDWTTTIVFGPEQNPEGELTSRIQEAKRSVLFSMSAFSTGSTLDDALIGSYRRGVEVFGLLDGIQAGQRWAATDALERAGTHLHVTENLFPAKLHHKLVVLDDATVCIGTFNYSASARNNEEVVIALTPRLPNASSTLAAYAKREVLRIQRQCSVSASRLLGG